MTDEIASSASDREGAVPLASLLAAASASLRDAGIADPRREARLLVAHALGLSADGLLRLPRDHPVPPGAAHALVRRRAGREPLAFITGRAAFWTLDLACTPATLIPRADTETLIEAAIALRPDRALPHAILDLGCGTGALLLAALAEYPAAWGVGIDRSAAACRLARGNAARNALSGRAALVCGDWADPLGEQARFGLVLSNPPYIETASIAGLMPEVARHEPAAALDGGPDGLAAYRSLLPRIGALLAADGIAVLEHGAGQHPAVVALAAAAGLAVAASRSDLSGHIRAICLRHR